MGSCTTARTAVTVHHPWTAHLLQGVPVDSGLESEKVLQRREFGHCRSHRGARRLQQCDHTCYTMESERITTNPLTADHVLARRQLMYIMSLCTIAQAFVSRGFALERAGERKGEALPDRGSYRFRHAPAVLVSVGRCASSGAQNPCFCCT